jgi:hypothetical protein
MAITGVEALVLLVEQEMGFQAFTDREMGALRKQARGFYKHLRRKGLSRQAVEEIIERIRGSTRWELEHDWYDQFLVATRRVDSDFAIERDIYDSNRLSIAEYWDMEVADDEAWEDKITEIAARNEDGYWERWKLATDRMAAVEYLVEELEKKDRLEREDTTLIAKLGEELNLLRFGKQSKRTVAFPHSDPAKRSTGCIEFKPVTMRTSKNQDGIYISATAWKKMRNRLNSLLGDPHRYPVTVKEKKEPLDALEVAVYGLYLDGTSS